MHDIHIDCLSEEAWTAAEPDSGTFQSELDMVSCCYAGHAASGYEAMPTRRRLGVG